MASVNVNTPIGPLWFAASEVGLRRVSFGEGEVVAGSVGARELLGVVRGQLEEYFGGGRRVFEVPLDWGLSEGWALEVRRVLWEKVGYGDTVSYGELAALAGRPDGARAVGGIMAGNPIPVVVPCHRVIAADGGIGGFAGSGGTQVETKRRLLTMEGAMPPTLFDL
ncbi:methylated-DNA/protein-cysteinemethyltransferase [Stackebrandtia nassauensis DSM 44728]|uniref:Methylated-DNA--protein-cysteine methyltransferase n=2 Tax=Stackebrandtia TaxID=283810 RepID=D3Q775_STANL|nr:methylated-DNA/protein-cysteinemethyltransferase [Stackebrandtia nassauensis DSM 44728]